MNGGTLSLNATTVSPGTAGSLTVSNAALALDVSGGASLPASNVTLQNNTALNFSYGALGSQSVNSGHRPRGSLSAPGSAITINISALGETARCALILYRPCPRDFATL